MAAWSWCLVFAVVFGPAAVLAQDDFKFELPKELQEFALPLPGSPGAVAPVGHPEQANDTSAGPQGAAAAQPEEQADQPQEEAVPTRPPTDPAKVSTFPPLVHGNATANGTKTEETTAMPAETTTSKKAASAAFYANALLVLGGACALHLFY